MCIRDRLTISLGSAAEVYSKQYNLDIDKVKEILPLAMNSIPGCLLYTSYQRVMQSVQGALRSCTRQAPSVAKNLKDKMHTVKAMERRRCV